MISARGAARAAGAAMVIAACACAASANVFNMGDGLTSLEFVTVGNPGNAADMRRQTDGTWGYGAVSYTYNIGKYEVTAGQYTAFLNAVAVTDTYGLYNTRMWSSAYGCKIERTATGGGYSYSVASDRADRPVNYVSWGDAARFANWLHNGQPTGAQGLTTTEDGAYYLNGATSDAALLAVTREADWKWAITSEDEWYKAAYHKNDGDTGNYFDYATTSHSVPGRDMTETTNPGNNANYYGIPYPIDSGKYTTVAGEFELSDSPYGTFDQGGNVWEWNEAVIGSYRGLRGGSFGSSLVIFLHAARRISYYPTYESDSVGFRVSEVPEPATLSLLALGGLVALRRRG